jgi:type I restriction enzyme S subunit
LRASWAEVALGEIATLRSGGTPDKKRPELYGGHVPWISSADIVNGEVAEPRVHITDQGLSVSAASLAQARQILLVTRTGVGKVAVAPYALSYSQDITALIEDRRRVDADYLVHYLRTRQQWLLARARGATIQGVTRDVVRAMPVPLPPIDEQRRIARILDCAAAIHVRRDRATALIQSMLSSEFLTRFGDPVTNPRQWPMRTLSQVGALERGVSRHRPRNAPELLNGPYPLIQTGDVARSGGLLTAYSATYSEAGLLQSRLWPVGTLCITIAANIAMTGVLTFKACFPDSVVGFSADSDLTAFVQAWLGFLQPVLERSAPQSAQRNINLQILRGLPIPVPPSSEVAAFAATVRTARDLKTKMETNLELLSTMESALQERAFSRGL